MANLNKVMLIGRLTRDPEVRTFTNGGKVASFGFAVNNRKKNQQTNEWEEEPVFVDVKAFNRDSGRKLADLVEQYLRKGQQAYVEGHLVLEEWQDKNDGSKRSKLRVVMDNLQFLEPRSEGAAAEGRSSRTASAPRQTAQARSSSQFDEPESFDPPEASGEGSDNIPF